jgi:predicted  nucleic acid-binding Zn-ribbon protein
LSTILRENRENCRNSLGELKTLLRKMDQEYAALDEMNDALDKLEAKINAETDEAEKKNLKIEKGRLERERNKLRSYIQDNQ